MKRTFGLYAIILAIALAIFNVGTFVIPEYGNMEKYSTAFWVGYVSITVASMGQLACVWYSLKVKNINKVFYNIPIVNESVRGLWAVFIVGVLFMFAPIAIAGWFALVICIAVLGFSVIAVLKASMAASVINEVEEKVKTKTFFIKSLTADAESLGARATTDEMKSLCKKVYESVRFSDPMSDPALAGVENQISECFAAFAYAVKTGNTEQAMQTANEFTALVTERNNKCKLFK